MSLANQLLQLHEAKGKTPAEGFASDIGASKFKVEDGYFYAYIPKKYSSKEADKVLAYFDDMGFKDTSVGNDSYAIAKYLDLEKEYEAKKGMFVETEIPKGKIIKESKYKHNDISKGKLKKLKQFSKMTRKAYEFGRNSGYYELEKPATELDTTVLDIIDDMEGQMNEATVIDFGVKLDQIKNLKKLPKEIQKEMKDSHNLNSLGFQEVVGHEKDGRTLKFSAGGSWDDEDFTVTSYGSKEYQWSPSKGLRKTTNEKVVNEATKMKLTAKNLDLQELFSFLQHVSSGAKRDYLEEKAKKLQRDIAPELDDFQKARGK